MTWIVLKGLLKRISQPPVQPQLLLHSTQLGISSLSVNDCEKLNGILCSYQLKYSMTTETVQLSFRCLIFNILWLLSDSYITSFCGRDACFLTLHLYVIITTSLLSSSSCTCVLCLMLQIGRNVCLFPTEMLQLFCAFVVLLNWPFAKITQQIVVWQNR